MSSSRDRLQLLVGGKPAGIGDLVAFRGFEDFPAPIFWLIAGTVVKAGAVQWLLLPCDYNLYPGPEDDEIEREPSAGDGRMLSGFILRLPRSILVAGERLSAEGVAVVGHLGPEGVADLGEVLAMAARGWLADTAVDPESAVRQRLLARHLGSLDAAIARAFGAMPRLAKEDFAAVAGHTRSARLTLVASPRAALAAAGGETLLTSSLEKIDLGGGRSAEFYWAPKTKAVMLRVRGAVPDAVLCGDRDAVQVSPGVYQAPATEVGLRSSVWRLALGADFWILSVDAP
jgi:hypothetical protein